MAQRKANFHVSLERASIACSKNLRFDHDDTGILVGSSFTSLYTQAGSGLLHGFTFHFATSNIQLKLTIDTSDVIFDLTYNQISSVQSQGQGIGNPHIDRLCRFISVSPNGMFNVCFECPLEFETEVKIEAKTTLGPDKNMEDRIVFIEVDQ